MNLKELHEFLDGTPVKKPVSALIIKGTLSTVDCKVFGDLDTLAAMLAYVADADEQLKQVLTAAYVILNTEDDNDN